MSNTNIVVERIGESVELGEGPHWDVDTQSLYFVSILDKSIHRYVPATNKYTKAVIGTGTVSFIIPIEGENNKFIIGLGRKLAKISWDGVSDSVSNIETLAEVENAPEQSKNQINDGKADSSGRLWFGTMKLDFETTEYAEEHKGAFYSFTGPQKAVKTQVTGITLSNGIAFNEILGKLYYIDSHERKVFQFDFDVVSGTISNQETIFTLEKHDIPGVPDGQTIDIDGNLWVAVFNGSRVIKIDPRKPETLLQTIEIPVAQVTSVTFGGPNLDELYVTTGRVTLEKKVLNPSDGHGFTYKVTGIGTRGYPGAKVKI